MSDNRLYVHVLLDRSGSMESCRDSTIAAFNDYIAKLKEAWKTATRVSLTLFDSESIELVHDAVPVTVLPPMTRATFVPRGATPLLDAIGQTVARVDGVALADGERVALVMLTDGLENASREHTRDSIRKLLAGRQEDQNWLILYLGANQDAFQEAGALGVGAGHAMSYAIGSEAQAFTSIRSSMRRYVGAPSAAAGRAAAVFTDEERDAAGSARPGDRLSPK